MGLLKKVEMQQSAAKVGIFGRQGSGKTTTASLFALGLSKTYHNGAPVAFFDTEGGSQFVKDVFDAEKVELVGIQSKAFEDMREAIKEAAKVGCCAYLVDSYTHPWKELVDSFKARSKRKRLEMHHMDELKTQWGVWTNLMLNSPLHVILAGRLGFEWGEEDDEETGGRKLIKLGTKLKSEADAGYEPNLLIEMEQMQESDARNKKTRAKKGSTEHYAYVLKDRWRSLNGRTFTFKTMNAYKAGDYKKVFDPFAPHWERLAIGTKHQSVDGDRSSESLFDTNGQASYSAIQRRKDIAADEVQGMLVAVWPGQDANSKGGKARAIRELFNVFSWTAVQEKSLEELERAVAVMRMFLDRMQTGAVSAAEVDSAIALLVICRETVLAETPELKIGAVAGETAQAF